MHQIHARNAGPAELALAAAVLTAAIAPSPLAATGIESGPSVVPGDTVPLYDDLGDLSYEVTTRVPEAQAYFDQGLRLYYAFNHKEAIRSFRQAQRLDPRCAMCWWGEALAWGPNINLPLGSASGAAAFDALREARARAEGVSERERAFIEALAERYGPEPTAARSARDSAYARAMSRVVERFPDDPEARTLHAEALMTLSPWNYWEKDGTPRPDTPILLEGLERVMDDHPDHPGANHFYIHAVEAVDPERALGAAERLAGLMPGAGHLVHMPGHIYVRVGRYADAIEANEHAVHADESWIQDQSPEMGVYVAGYYPHNYDFLAFAASMIGREDQAIGAAEKMRSLVPGEMLGAPGMTFLQQHLTRHLQFKVRFGRWDDILEVPMPREGLSHAVAVWHYAQGRARTARGALEEAESHLEQLRELATNPALADARLEFNASGDVLAVAAKVLAGHLAAARGDHDAAVTHLREAAAREDALVYGEPPEWSVPVRQDLGRVLLNAGRADEAEAVFREDLDRFPANGWSLHGLARCLEARGKEAEAAKVRAEFREIWEGGDPPVAMAGS